jgi:hypothetical protein
MTFRARPTGKPRFRRSFALPAPRLPTSRSPDSTLTLHIRPFEPLSLIETDLEPGFTDPTERLVRTTAGAYLGTPAPHICVIREICGSLPDSEADLLVSECLDRVEGCCFVGGV